jgi:hypothetical protein
MGKYLLDPIKSFEEIRSNFILYIKTAFGTRFKESENGTQNFESEREDLMAVGRKLRRILSRAIPELRNLKGVVDMTPMSVEL